MRWLMPSISRRSWLNRWVPSPSSSTTSSDHLSARRSSRSRISHVWVSSTLVGRPRPARASVPSVCLGDREVPSSMAPHDGAPWAWLQEGTDPHEQENHHGPSPTIGVFLPTMTARGEDLPDLAAAARHAEDLGFESVWVVDQLVAGTGVPFLDSTVALAAAAGADRPASASPTG